MAGTVIPMGKRRPTDRPYLTIEDYGRSYRVLKAYTHGPEARFARWYCQVTTPFATDLGDVYISDIRGRITQRDPEVPDSALPAWLR